MLTDRELYRALSRRREQSSTAAGMSAGVKEVLFRESAIPEKAKELEGTGAVDGNREVEEVGDDERETRDRFCFLDFSVKWFET